MTDKKFVYVAPEMTKVDATAAARCGCLCGVSSGSGSGSC